MKFTTAALLLLAATAPSVAVGYEPHSVYVVEQNSHTRCGPGEEFYRTDRLKHGQELVVYAKTTDGWLGVQPPPESFDWVPADAIDIQPGGQTGAVNEDRLVAWIGTHLGRARRYRWQVQLAEDETVTILKQSQREGPDGPQNWLQIVPPSGEFRWIHSDEVVFSSEELIERVKEINRIANSRQNNQRLSQSGQPSATTDSGPSVLQTANHTDASSRPSETKPAVSDSSSPDRSSLTARVDLGSPISRPMEDQQPSNRPEADAPIGSGLLAYLGNVKLRSPITKRDAEAADSDQQRSAERVAELARNEDQWQSSTIPRVGPAKRSAADFPVANGSAIGSGLATVGYSEPDRTLRQADPTAMSPPAMLSGQAALAAKTLTPITDLQAGNVSSIQSASGSFFPLPVPSPGPSIANHSVTPSLNSFGQSRQPTGLNSASSSGSRPAEPIPHAAPAPPAPRMIAADRIEQVRQTADRSDASGLNLLLSRLMTVQASSIESNVLLESIDRRVGELGDQSALRQRVAEYTEMARRREMAAPVIAQPSVGLNSAPALRAPMNSIQPISGTTTLIPLPESIPAVSINGSTDSGNGYSSGEPLSEPSGGHSDSPSVSPLSKSQSAEAKSYDSTYDGQLVQVYSARPGSPPFALTDSTGQTICYVTPVPGVNLRNHLNSRISISGPQGYLAGLSPPHVRAATVIRR